MFTARMNSPRRELGFATEDSCDAEYEAYDDCQYSIPGCNKCYDDADKLAGEEGCDCDGAADAAEEKCDAGPCSSLEKKCAPLEEALDKCEEGLPPLPDDDGSDTDEDEDGDDNADDADDDDVDCDSVCGPEQFFAVNA